MTALWWAGWVGGAIAITAAVVLGWPWWRTRRAARRLMRRRASTLEQSERLWDDFYARTPVHPATRLEQHGAGAIRYFARNAHDHRPGRQCAAPGCNWPRR